jgi:uncharacterized protein
MNNVPSFMKIKTPRKIRLIIDTLLPFQPEKIYLFGSWARNEADSLSDVDLVIIKKTRASFFNRLKQVKNYLPSDLGSIDVLVYTPQEFDRMQRDENAFAEMITEEGVLVYAR